MSRFFCPLRYAVAVTLSVVAVCAVAFILSCRIYSPHRSHDAGPAAEQGPLIRVLLASGLKEVSVSSEKGGIWTSAPEDKGFAVDAGTISVVPGRSSAAVNGRTVKGSRQFFLPFDGLFKFGEVSYRGGLELKLTEEGVYVFERVHLEDYLRGVLPAEIYPHWPVDAIVAQAVAIRTFILNIILDSNTRDWLTTLDLAYKGAELETGRTDLAAELSAGLILTFSGDLFPAFFHSTCGGGTASAYSVFGAHDIPPLEGTGCTGCFVSRFLNWEAVFTLDEIAEALSLAGTTINSIETLKRDASGRAEYVIINGEKKLRSSEFRLDVGSTRLRSTRFEVDILGNAAVFRGTGFGHGVGMCQWGAYAMAKEGKGWEDILKYYYPGASVKLLTSND